MRTIRTIFLLAVIALATSTPAMAEDRNPDYATADGKDWVYNHQIEVKRCQDEPVKETNIDLFYIYPTVCMQQTEYSKTHDGFVSIDDEGMREDAISLSSAKGAFFTTSMTFASYTQVYAPYYRQATMVDEGIHGDNDSTLCEYLYKGLAYQDVKAALDYYFSTLNPAGHRRPFILAGHSQGSALLRLVMEHYFSQPDKVALLDSMVACYAIGFGIGESGMGRIEAATGVKFASDATSSKVYVSWNTEGPGGCGVCTLWPADAVAVNPLSWTTDGVAGPELNTGARQGIMSDEVRPGLYGAEISDHGTVICREMPARNYMDPSAGLGDRCLHGYDYAAYWNNIGENGMRRAAKMAGWIPVKVTGLDEHTYIAQYQYKLQGETIFKNEAARAGATYWVPATAIAVQVVVNATDGYKLASGKSSDKVNVTVSTALQEGTVVVDVTGHGAKWDSQRKPDYSYAKDWFLNHTLSPKEAKTIGGEPAEDTGVDLFYLYPTSCLVLNDSCVKGVCDIEDQYMRSADGAAFAWDMAAKVFAGMVNVYTPYYRQTPTETELQIIGATATYVDAYDSIATLWYNNAPYQDATDALDYYFTQFNPNGDRPFIIASHSHGTGILHLIMKNYFTQEEKKPLLKNLVACYAVGMGLSKTDMQTIENGTKCATGLADGVKMATDATSTGVYIMWNTEGPDTPDDMMSALWPADPAPAVNPILWTQDTTYAPASLNLGGWREFGGSIETGLYDAKCNLAHGTVVCSSPLLEGKYTGSPYFGLKSFHSVDYGLYWENIRQNANERIHTMTGKYPIEPKGKVLKYDLEHHFATSDFVHYLETRTALPMIKDSIPLQRVGQDFGNNIYAPILSGGKSIYDQLTNLGQDRIDEMDKAGVDVTLLGASLSVEELELAPSCYWARIHNDSAYAYSQRYPNRVIPTMTLPVANVDSAIAEMKRCYDIGFRMWFARSNFGYRYPRLYDPVYEPLLAKAEELGVSVYLHPEVPTEPSLLDNGVGYAEPGLGYGQDVMKTLVRLILNGTFDRHPHLRMVVGHYGEWLPFTMDRIDHMYKVAQQNPQLKFQAQHDVDYYVRHHNIQFTSSGNMDPLVYQFTMDRIGSTSCLMFGSDYPYENYSNAVHALDTLHLSEQDERVYWQDNVLKYILTDTPAWDSIAKPEPVTPVVKTPSVRGYDFEHHYYVPAFFDTCALRTKSPYYDPSEQILYVHSQYSMPVGGIYGNITTFRDGRIAVMDQVGMNTAVMSCSEGVVECDSSAVVALCRMSNDSVIEMGKRYPGRIMGEMILPINSEQEAIKEMHRCYDAGMRVWCVSANFGTSDTTATHIYDAQYEPLLAEADELGLSLYIHPQVTTDADCQDFGYIYGAAIYGFTIESMRTSIRLILNGSLDRYPNLKIIIPHVGEYLPFVLERMDNRFFSVEDPYVVCKKTIREYIADHRVFISTSGMVNNQCLGLAMKTLGVDAIVYASDYPYEDYANMVNTFCSANLSQEELDKIWGGNAEKYILTNLPSALDRPTDSPVRRFTKFIQDGQLVIECDGVRYNAQGIKLSLLKQ